VRSRTSCKVPDVPARFCRPTEPQAAAFILPSCGRVSCSPCPHRRTCDKVRNSTNKGQETHYGLRSDDLGTNGLSIGALLVSSTAAAGLDKRGSSAVRLPFGSLADVPSAFFDLVGTMHLTSHECGRRTVTLAYLAQPVACASAYWTRCQLHRNTRLSGGQGSARCAPRLSYGQHPRRRCRADPRSRDRLQLRNKLDQDLMSCCSVRQAE
jgi:hypothetical protein